MNGIEFALPGVNLFNLYQYILIFFVASLRITSFLISAPFFSLGGIPLQVRIVASISLTAFLFPAIEVPEIQNMESFNLFILLLSEIGIGLSVGLILKILFSAAAVAGEKIASTAGLSMSSMIDPQSGGQTLVLSTVLTLFLISCFLSLDGHLYLLKFLIESYVYLIQCSIGIITRSAPSLNLFSFGFPIALISVFIFLYLGVVPISNAFSDLTAMAINLIDEVLHSYKEGTP